MRVFAHNIEQSYPNIRARISIEFCQETSSSVTALGAQKTLYQVH